MDDELARSLTAARAGDEQGFTRLWRAYQPLLLRYLRVNVGDRAEDVASATWIDVIRSLERFEGNLDGFRGWLFTIAHRRAVDSHRLESRQPLTTALDQAPDLPADHGDPAQLVLDQWSAAAAVELLATLSPDQRDILSLRILADLDVATVARIVGKQPGAVRVASHRGLRELARRLAVTESARAGDGNPPTPLTDV